MAAAESRDRNCIRSNEAICGPTSRASGMSVAARSSVTDTHTSTPFFTLFGASFDIFG
jgi:hypothetical protein